MSMLRSRELDWVIALAATVAMVIELAVSPETEGPLAANLAVFAAIGVSLAWRRSRPEVSLAAIAVGFSLASIFLTRVTHLTSPIPVFVIACYAGGRYAADLRPVVLAIATAMVAVNLADDPANPDNWVFTIVLFGGCVFVGRALRTRALVAAELAERTERLAVEQDLRAAEAAVQERRRIARELHDVVAHTLSVMVVQAGGARRTLARDPQRAGEALDTVEATGRAALGELRRMLGFVGEGGSAAGAAAGGSAPLDPQPTLADLAALSRRAGAAGLPTEIVVEGEAGPLPVGEEVAVYRIVQEALTNALKHAGPGATATVTLRWHAGAVEVEVVDRGGSGGVALPSGGHGLVGMRERVGLFRGRLEAAPAGDGFRVHAWLPRATADADVAVGA